MMEGNVDKATAKGGVADKATPKGGVVDKATAKGRVKFVLTGPDGKIKDSREVHNLVVDVGLGYMASRMKDATDSVMSHMGMGTGSTAPDSADTALVAEVKRVALTSTTVTGAEIEYVGTFGPGDATGALKEAGIFNAASNGKLLCRTTFLEINKGAADTLAFTWTITIM